jgi:GR25 family glycosyltransferase involved in LPS biosynthesis
MHFGNIIKMFDKIYYINLDKRQDRRKYFEENVKEPLLQYFPEELWKRISAEDKTNETSRSKRAAGCSISHVNIWKDAQENGYKSFLVLEDDFKLIIEPSAFREYISELYRDFSNFTICNVAYNNMRKLNKINNSNFYKSWNIQTTCGYIAKTEFVKKMQPTIEYSIEQLNSNLSYDIWAIDQVWKKFQNNSNWILMKRAGIQLDSYSDIEKNHVKYGV